MDKDKLQDLIYALEGIDTWDLNTPATRSKVHKLVPKLIKALKDVALESKCENCDGRGFLTGTTVGPGGATGKCADCKGTGSKYYFLEL